MHLCCFDQRLFFVDSSTKWNAIFGLSFFFFFFVSKGCFVFTPPPAVSGKYVKKMSIFGPLNEFNKSSLWNMITVQLMIQIKMPHFINSVRERVSQCSEFWQHQNVKLKNAPSPEKQTAEPRSRWPDEARGAPWVTPWVTPYQNQQTADVNELWVSATGLKSITASAIRGIVNPPLAHPISIINIISVTMCSNQ